MIKNILALGFLAAGFIACSSEGIGAASQADQVTLDVRCAADTDCPTGFECEDEVEHGVTTSYCVSDDEQGTSTGACPAGYELEAEHGGTFCKPHGSGSSGGGGSDDNAGSTGTGAEGATCQSSADCAAGLECEVEVEAGITTSVCKAHGKNP